MDSLADHSRRQSNRDSGRNIRFVNRLLLLIGALLFVNGIVVTLITAFIPAAVASPVIIAFVTGCVGSTYIAYRYPAKTRGLYRTVRPVVAALVPRNRSSRQQGGL